MLRRRLPTLSPRRAATVTAVAAAGIGLVIGGSGAASAASTPAPDMHMHMTTPASGPHYARATPAVALVQATGLATTAFLKAPGVVIHSSDDGYSIPFAAANGVFVNNNGVLVANFGPSRVNKEQVRIAAVNDIFRDVYQIKPPANPFARHTIPDANENLQLQACYANSSVSPCVIETQVLYRVYPNHVKSGKGQLADLLSTTGDMLVLRAGGNVPTASVQPSLPNGTHEVSVIGFTGLPSIKTQPTIVPNHLVVNGKSAMLMEPDTVAKELGSYRYGAAVIDGENPTAPLIGVYTGGADGAGVTLYGQVQSTLQRAGISAQRGAIDDAFGNAETFYEVQHYAHAIAPLQSVLKLDPQNAVATIQLADSKMKANTPADKSSSDVGVTTPTSKSGGLAWWVWALIAVGVLALIAAVGIVLYRRRRGDGPGPGPSAPVALPDAGSGYLPQQSLAYAEPARVARQLPGGHAESESSHEAAVTRVISPVQLEAPLQSFRKQRHCTQCAAAVSPSAKFCGFCAHPTGN
jgi:hypothetical protein